MPPEPHRRVAAALQGGGAHVPQSFLRGAPAGRAAPKRSLPSIRIRERIVLDDDDEPSASKSTQQRRSGAAAQPSSSQCASASDASVPGASVPGGASVSGGASSSSVVLAKGAAVWYVKAARNERLEATVEAVHYDDTPPYYTVRFASGERRETTLEHLQERSGGGGDGGGGTMIRCADTTAPNHQERTHSKESITEGEVVRVECLELVVEPCLEGDIPDRL